MTSARAPDGAARLLRLATACLPPRWAGWGPARRCELAAIDDPDARRDFARGAAVVAFRRGLGVRVALPLATGVVVAAVVVVASREQLSNAGSGLLSVTVPVPALLVLVVALVAAFTARSLRVGLEAGSLALLACFAAVAAAVAVEGQVWMERRGVFVLDADAPPHPVDGLDVALDLFSTGMWVGHVVFWLPWVLVGAAVGAGLGAALGGSIGAGSTVRRAPGGATRGA